MRAGRPRRRATTPKQARAASIIVRGEWPVPIERVAEVIHAALSEADLCDCRGLVPGFEMWARYDEGSG